MKKILVVCTVLMSISITHAQQYGWRVISAPKPGYQMHAVEFVDSLHGWCEAGGQIYWTIDGGHIWTAAVMPSFGVIAISMSDTLNGWAVGYRGGVPYESAVLHTTDGGHAWVSQLYVQQRRYNDVSALSNQRAVVSGATSVFAVRDTGVIVKTNNAGSLWDEGTHLDSMSGLGQVEFIDSLHGWISTSLPGGMGSLLRTTNGGDDWQALASGVGCFSFVDTANGFAYGGRGYSNNDGFYLLRTRNGAQLWDSVFVSDASVAGDGVSINAISFVDTLNGWMFGRTFYQGDLREIIIHTTDGGNIWEGESIGLANIVSGGKMIDAHHGWAVTLSGEILGYGVVTGVAEQDPALPSGFVLKQNFPNPFNSTTVIEYKIPEQSSIELSVYDGLGKLVSRLVDGLQSSGVHRIQFDAHSLSSGVYFYSLTAGSFHNTKQLMLIK